MCKSNKRRTMSSTPSFISNHVVPDTESKGHMITIQNDRNWTYAGVW